MAFSRSLSITASVEATLPACRVVSVTMNTDRGHYPLDEALFAEQLAASLALGPPECYPMQVGVPWCNGFYLVTVLPFSLWGYVSSLECVRFQVNAAESLCYGCLHDIIARWSY